MAREIAEGVFFSSLIFLYSFVSFSFYSTSFSRIFLFTSLFYTTTIILYLLSFNP
jgi:hypothetical protein